MGLHIKVYRSATRDCTNGGLSSKFNTLTVVNASGPFEPTNSAPPVILVNHVYDCVSLRPAVKVDGKWKVAPGTYMAGGNFGHTSDSRFGSLIKELSGQHFYGAVAIHDRQE